MLSPDVLCSVFECLSPEEVIHVARVCSAWHDVALSPLVWNRLLGPELAEAAMLSHPHAQPVASTHATAATNAQPLQQQGQQRQQQQQQAEEGHAQAHAAAAAAHDRPALSTSGSPTGSSGSPTGGSSSTAAGAPAPLLLPQPGLAHLGHALTRPHLWLACYQRNLLRNPDFRASRNFTGTASQVG